MRVNTGIFLIALLIGLSACGSKRKLADDKPLRNRAPGFLMNKNTKEDFEYDWLGMKISADFSSEGQSDSFKVNVKAKKDSVLWISISPALGIEVVRMVITPDSLKYVSKVPNNKHYYLGQYGDVQDMIGMDVNFAQLVDLLVGNPVMLDKQDDKLESLVDDRQYFLISKFNRKLKKILELDEKQVLPNSVLTVNPLTKDYRKTKKRSSVEDLLVKRFWLNGQHYKLERAQFDDLYNLRVVEFLYSNFKEYDGQLYPGNGRLKVSEQDTWQQLEFKVTRLKTDKEYDFPFEIPDDFERRGNL